MIAARWPREDKPGQRLLQIDPRAGTMRDGQIRDLPRLLRSGDLLVVNDAATLPASLKAISGVEVRLLGELDDGTFRALLFGSGEWRIATEQREAPPPLPASAIIAFEGGLSARVERVSPLSPRLVDVRFDRSGSALWAALYRLGRPVQYSYAAGPLELWHVQVAYASRPWAVEMPSAGWPLDWELLLSLRERGVGLAAVTHAAGLSSTGDAALDAALPFPERFEVPAETANAVARARAGGGRVVAAGTSVVRALETAATQGASSGVTNLVIGPGHRLRAVDGLLTGVHEPTASHYSLLRAFVPDELLRRATHHSETSGYLAHEFGDSWLLLPGL